MKVETKYSIQETIRKLQDNTCTIEQYHDLKHRDRGNRPLYYGSISNDRFQVTRAHRIENHRGQALMVSGRIYEKNQHAMIVFWPIPTPNHIVALIFALMVVVLAIVMRSYYYLIPLPIICISSIGEYRLTREEYLEFGLFLDNL